MISDAKWITSYQEKLPVFVKEGTLSGTVKSATLQITAMGAYACYINGGRVGDFVLAPGWTNFKSHIQYQIYDVTDMLAEKFCMEIKCGNGWAVSAMGDTGTSVYTDHISCIFSLDITYENGSMESFISDKTTKVYTSDVLYTEIYHGEIVDRTRVSGFVDYATEEALDITLLAQIGEKICERERIEPICVFTTPKGETVLDFGQNMTGYVECRVHGKAGDVVQLSHAEVLDKEGNFYTENLRSARAQAKYILGKEHETFKPLFTFYGFRYVRVDAYPGEVRAENFTAIEVHSDITRTGGFVCGHDKLNQLYHNIIWGQKDNFLDVPTDCPQRDERQGWTGDAAAFVRTAAINFDVERFFEKWLYDLRTEQHKDGGVPAAIPWCYKQQPISAAWGDAAVVCPWELYRAYGNKKVLEESFESMRKWVEYMHAFGEEEYLWLSGEHFGDWLGLDAEEGSYVGATDKDLIASCYFAYSTNLLIYAGKVLGKDMSAYETLYENIRQAIDERFLKDGLPKCKTQTACALLLRFDLCDEKDKVAALLASLVKSSGHLTTGFVGTPHLLHALSENGYADIAYDLLLREEYPSWLYSVNKGATTIWEHWDGIKEDGSFWSPDMNSFNHYAYGAVFDWMFENIGGIKQREGSAGYADVLFAPMPDVRLGFADTSIKIRRGLLRSTWRYENKGIRFEFTVPQGTHAAVVLPDGQKYSLCEGEYVFYTK